jgi:hypothetical protein
MTVQIETKVKLRCIERELGFRKYIYPRRIEAGRMSAELAEQEIRVMEAICDDYRARLEAEEPRLDLG